MVIRRCLLLCGPTIRSLIFTLIVISTSSAIAKAQSVINVSNIEQLYQAINNPNPAAVVVLAPGIYALTTKDPNGQPRPNGGRLILQSGMALVGQNEYVDFDGDGIWDGYGADPVRGLIFAAPATETIINAANIVSGTQGAIGVGLENRVEKLTIRNTSGIGAAIDVNVRPAVGGMSAEIRDCLLEDGQRGIRMTHSQLNGIDSSALVERTISRRHTGAFGFGVQIQNGRSTDSSWDVTLRNNLCYGNRFGLFVAGNNGSTTVQSHVISMRNEYRLNQTGVNLFAGLDGGNGNSIHFTSVADEIFDNRETDNQGHLGAGVIAVAGVRSAASAAQSSNNHLVLQFLGTHWLGNYQGTTNRRDLVVYGATAFPGAGSPGVNDTASVLVRNGTSDEAPGAFQFIDSEPIDLTNTNEVTVLGSNLAFMHTNVGIDPLPEWQFASEMD